MEKMFLLRGAEIGASEVFYSEWNLKGRMVQHMQGLPPSKKQGQKKLNRYLVFSIFNTIRKEKEYGNRNRKLCL